MIRLRFMPVPPFEQNISPFGPGGKTAAGVPRLPLWASRSMLAPHLSAEGPAPRGDFREPGRQASVGVRLAPRVSADSTASVSQAWGFTGGPRSRPRAGRKGQEIGVRVAGPTGLE